MKDEIKEIKKLIAIVNCMKDSELLDNGEYYKVHSDFIISLEENKTQLLDYITNLQEENERLKEILHWKQIENNIFYKSRCEKALDYINSKKDYWNYWHFDNSLVDIEGSIEKILNILKGEDEE